MLKLIAAGLILLAIARHNRHRTYYYPLVVLPVYVARWSPPYAPNFIRAADASGPGELTQVHWRAIKNHEDTCFKDDCAWCNRVVNASEKLVRLPVHEIRNGDVLNVYG